MIPSLLHPRRFSPGLMTAKRRRQGVAFLRSARYIVYGTEAVFPGKGRSGMIAGLSGAAGGYYSPYPASLPAFANEPAPETAATASRPPAADNRSDPLTDQAIRKAEAVVAEAAGASPTEAARAQGAIVAARALAARGAAVAARLVAAQAARGVAAELPGSPAAGAGSGAGKGAPAGGQPVAPGRKPESEHVYQDSSGDPNASFQSPTAMTPGQAAIMVPQHEREHIIHAQSQAMASGREIVSAYTVVY